MSVARVPPGGLGAVRGALIAAALALTVVAIAFIVTGGYRQPLSADEPRAWAHAVWFHSPSHYAEAVRDYKAAAGPLNYVLWAAVSSWADYDPRTMRLLSSLLYVVAVVCAWWLIRSRDPTLRGWLWWGIILLLPHTVVLAFSIMTDMLFSALVLGALVALPAGRERGWGPVLAGLLLGIGCLSRIWALAVAGGLAVPLLRRRAWPQAAWLVAPSLAAAAVLYALWGGLTPPATQGAHRIGVAPQALVGTLALVGLFAFPVLASVGRRRQAVLPITIGAVVGALGVVVETRLATAAAPIPAGFVTHALEFIAASLGIAPAAGIMLGALAGLGAAVLTHLTTEAVTSHDPDLLGYVCAALGLVCANAVHPYFVERYAAPVVWLVVLACVFSAPRHDRAGEAEGREHVPRLLPAALVMCALLTVGISAEWMGLVGREAIGRASLPTVTWAGSSRKLLESITEAMPVGQIDARRSLAKWHHRAEPIE